MKKILFFIVLFFVAKNIAAQDNAFFTWDAFQLVAKVNAKWHWISDISYRTIGISSSANQYTFRTAVKRVVNEKWSTTAGVALFRSRTSIDKHNHEFGDEYRLWQEVLLENKLNKSLVISNRFRTEERFFAATATKNSYNALRLRYRLAFIQDITKKVKFQIADEYMRQLSKGDFLFQQNRVAATGIFTTGKKTQLTAGYMWSKLPTTSQHYILLVLQKTISFKKENNGQK
ncbi:DUF2490 domain-containing protein [Ferruginibacter lapsinanis]|uniref:DUF2490 domain-containing protein n=1 Tax=Ferruginibacter lapsinanis TaxID=563172 RepID=UPI001E2A8E8A|nr:DUF2490 domain-containing protein [Ferruginibacter lapsinanis]UEG48996.1 DUF2490 domain-containing protein [Ferruginibacter lapsinanis]